MQTVLNSKTPADELRELLREARAHVAATIQRAPSGTALEAAQSLIMRIDAALLRDEEKIIWP